MIPRPRLCPPSNLSPCHSTLSLHPSNQFFAIHSSLSFLVILTKADVNSFFFNSTSQPYAVSPILISFFFSRSSSASLSVVQLSKIGGWVPSATIVFYFIRFSAFNPWALFAYFVYQIRTSPSSGSIKAKVGYPKSRIAWPSYSIYFSRAIPTFLSFNALIAASQIGISTEFKKSSFVAWPPLVAKNLAPRVLAFPNSYSRSKGRASVIGCTRVS